MEEHEKSIIGLGIIGALIAAGQILSSDEPLSLRLFLGRVIMGSATSVAAASVLVWIPGISPLAIAGLGAALGIAGYQVIELWVRRQADGLLKRRPRDLK